MTRNTNIPETERAMTYALRVLGYRARAEAEMRRRLQQKGFTPEATDRTLAELMRLGLLDDRDFARGWVAERRTARGPARLRQELRQKGVPRDVAEEAIHTGLSAEEELTSATAVARRALRSVTTPPDRETVARLRRLLLRRGFRYEVVSRVCAGISHKLSVEGDWLEESP